MNESFTTIDSLGIISKCMLLTKDMTVKNRDHPRADRAVENGSPLKIDPGVDAMVTYLSIQVILSNSALDCRVKN